MKSFKKVLATTLAATMVITAIPVSPANAASNPKLNKTKMTAYVNKNYKGTIKVTVPSSWKSVKVTAKSSKKSVAKVSKASAKKITVKAVKKGTAKVTVKVTGKNSKGKKLSWSKVCTVTVKNPSLSIKAGKTTLNVGETTTIKATKKPGSASVTYTSSNTAVASVGKSTGKVTANAAGTATITASMKTGTKTTKKTLTIKVVGEDGLTTSLVSHVAGQDHAVLVGSNATVSAKVIKNGAAAKNAQVIITAVQTTDRLTGARTNADYEVLSSQSAVTDANGVATFVIGNKKTVTSITDTTAIGEVRYTVSLADNSVDPVTDVVDFVAIKYGDIVYKNGSTGFKNRVPGTNYKDVNAASAKDGSAATKSVNGLSDVAFVASQQTSTLNDTDHEVTFVADPKLVYDKGASAAAGLDTFEQPVNETSGKYHTYANLAKVVELNVDMSQLQYATLLVTDIQISKYSKLVVSAYNSKENAEKGTGTGLISGSTQTLEGEKEQSSFGYQIPKNNAVKAIRVEIVSQGQVNTGKNAGFKLDKVVGMYQKTASTSGTTTEIGGVTIDWSTENTIYSEDKVLPAGDAATLGIDQTNKTNYKYLYQVPVFPQAGNAIIREYDANSNLKAYYAVPAVNMTKQNTNGAWDIYVNENDIYAHKDASNQVITGSLVTSTNAFLITKDEATKAVGTVTQEGNTVKVNSTDEGTTKVVGTVKIAGTDGISTTPVEYAKIYTSVLWSPIPKGATASTTNEAFVAVRGQSVKVDAQITDKNGHPVAQSNVNVKFSYKTNGSTSHDIDGVGALSSNNGKVKVTSQTTETDPNGKSQLVLQSAEVDTLQDLEVAVIGANATKYDAKLVIKDKTVDKADIYWVNAYLTYTPSAVQYTSAADTAEYTASSPEIPVSEPQVGETWEYGVKVKSDALVGGALNGATASIVGLKTAFKTTGMTDGVTVAAVEGSDHAATVTSTKGGLTKLKASLDTSAINENATVTVTKGSDVLPATYAGTGSVNIFDTITIPVQWTSVGVTAKYVSPYGSNAAGSDRVVYLKVVDNHGNAIDAKNVTFTVNNGTLSAATGAAVTVTTGGSVVATNGDGIAKIMVTKDTAASSIVTAQVDGVTETFSTTINWRTETAKLQPVQAVYSQGTPDTVEVTFNKDIYEGSVNAKEFKLESADTAVALGTASAVKIAVAKAEVVNGNKVRLTLSGSNVLEGKSKHLKVTVGDATIDSVVYSLTSEIGEAVKDGTQDITFVSDADVSMTASGSGTTITVNVDSASDGDFKAYAVNENGVVVESGTISVTAGTTATGTMSVAGSGYYKVYCGNVVKDVTIQ